MSEYEPSRAWLRLSNFFVDIASISKFPVNVIKLTLTLHTHADAQRGRLRRVGKTR